MDLSRNGSREEQSLSRNLRSVGQASNDLLDLAPESLLEKTIGLVEDKSAARGQLALEVGVLEVVEDTTRGGDEDVAALLVQSIRLGIHVGTTDDLGRARGESAG